MTEASGQSATYSDASIVRSGSYSDALVLGVRCTRLFFLDWRAFRATAGERRDAAAPARHCQQSRRSSR